MKQLPNTIKIRTLGNGIPISNMFVRLTIKTNYKNSFDLIFGPSNSTGTITVTSDDIIREAEKDRRLFIMDYGDPVENFSGEIEITPLNQENLSKARAAYNMFKEHSSYPKNYEANLGRSIQAIDGKNIKTLSVEIVYDDKDINIVGRTVLCKN